MVDLDLLMQLDRPIPRYTSYPTAPEWGSITHDEYSRKLVELGKSNDPVALYFHIPFCHSMCLFCGCSVILNRKKENETRYVDYLIQEIELVARTIGQKKRVRQLHFGGGTPTKIAEEEFVRLFRAIEQHFQLEADAEIAIEIDPRGVFEDRGAKLHLIKSLGFTRVSFGVQDTNEKVQEAVRRRQSYDITKYTYDLARSLEFEGISIDLIYGLPYQTLDTFTETIEKIIDLSPDRLSLFSYAKLPWLKEHQKAIKDETLPSTKEKFQIYLMARKKMVESGYQAIGMDHFAKQSDDMAKAYKEKRLQRNFQGYTVLDVDDLISFGITAIGYVQKGYFQNVKELETYYGLLDKESLPTFRGKLLSQEDLVRRFVIQRLMCDFRLDKELFLKTYERPFEAYFSDECLRLKELFPLGLYEEDDKVLKATPLGELFIRNIASSFDWYLAQKEGHKQFSKAI